ncbi:MAG: outer membrane beta-barrel protein, partial [Tenacibaculum sp.]
MKKLLFISMIFVFGISNGQEKKEKLTIKKGTWYLNGSTYLNSNDSFQENNENTSNQLNFNISPKIGYTIEDNLIIGIGLGYGYNESNYNDTNTGNNNSYSIFPYVKKHFSIGKNLTFSILGEINYTYSENNNNYYNNLSLESVNSTSNSYSIMIKPGITYFVSNKFALEANIGSLGYTRNSVKREEE